MTDGTDKQNVSDNIYYYYITYSFKILETSHGVGRFVYGRSEPIEYFSDIKEIEKVLKEEEKFTSVHLTDWKLLNGTDRP